MERLPSCRRPRAMVCLKSRSAPGKSPAARADLADSKLCLRRVPGSSAERVAAPKNAEKAKSNSTLEQQFNDRSVRRDGMGRQDARLAKSGKQTLPSCKAVSEWTLAATVCRSTGWRQSLALADSRPFYNRVNGVRSYVFQGFDFA